jgi:hypothetical protein
MKKSIIDIIFGTNFFPISFLELPSIGLCKYYAKMRYSIPESLSFSLIGLKNEISKYLSYHRKHRARRVKPCLA